MFPFFFRYDPTIISDLNSRIPIVYGKNLYRYKTGFIFLNGKNRIFQYIENNLQNLIFICVKRNIFIFNINFYVNIASTNIFFYQNHNAVHKSDCI